MEMFLKNAVFPQKKFLNIIYNLYEACLLGCSSSRVTLDSCLASASRHSSEVRTCLFSSPVTMSLGFNTVVSAEATLFE